MSARRATTRRELEEHSYHPAIIVIMCALSLFFGMYLPHIFPRFAILDLPFIVVLYFAVSWRGAIAGTLLGAGIGLLQDLPTNGPIGVYGIAKSIVGYTAASIGLKVDVDNVVTRAAFTFGFSLLQSTILFVIRHYLLGMPEYSLVWLHELVRAGVTTAVALPIYFLLDRARTDV